MNPVFTEVVGSAGSITRANEPCGVSDNALIIRFIGNTNQAFLFHLLTSLHLDADISKNAQPLITSTALMNKVVAFPEAISEQFDIAEFLDTELAKFDTLTAEAQRAIDLLQERRTALISAAVTGQIDVRQTPKN
jgi:type I restriction enzyme S subunit